MSENRIRRLSKSVRKKVWRTKSHYWTYTTPTTEMRLEIDLYVLLCRSWLECIGRLGKVWPICTINFCYFFRFSLSHLCNSFRWRVFVDAKWVNTFAYTQCELRIHECNEIIYFHFFSFSLVRIMCGACICAFSGLDSRHVLCIHTIYSYEYWKRWNEMKIKKPNAYQDD